MNTSARRDVRCAVYVRRSSDEGLEQQQFNSLHAQREACEAYIQSQKGEGWVGLRDRYEDAGFSGGSANRPALKRLMLDIDAGRIDVVAVYKVDRLTRSLADFARLVEKFDKRAVSFVSVTQGFNTTSSSGRLTLNVLLSFAQFERDVTGERIRDKIAASKAKGMWMGGIVPLGYRCPTDRSSRALVLDPEDARLVRSIFLRYLALQSLTALQRSLFAEGVRPRQSGSVPAGGGRNPLFSTGALRHLLTNRIYVGEIVHKGTRYAGRHEAILDEQTFEAVQTILDDHSQRARQRETRADRTLLRGIIFDEDGQVMAPWFSKRPDKLYQYYKSPPLAVGRPDDAVRCVRGSAADQIVRDVVGRILATPDPLTPTEIRTVVRRVNVGAATVELTVNLRAVAADAVPQQAYELLRHRLAPGHQLTAHTTSADLARVVIPVRLAVWGGRKWVTGPAHKDPEFNLCPGQGR